MMHEDTRVFSEGTGVWLHLVGRGRQRCHGTDMRTCSYYIPFFDTALSLPVTNWLMKSTSQTHYGFCLMSDTSGLSAHIFGLCNLKLFQIYFHVLQLLMQGMY